MLFPPMLLGYIPVIRAFLLGAHTPATEYMRVKRIPSAASWSRLGVNATGSP
jgi:hypothetical protein